MRLLMCAVIASMAAALPTCSTSRPDVEVSLQAHPYLVNLMFDIQAVADDEVVSDVVFNRSGCTAPSETAAELSSTVKLKFGQSWGGYSPDCVVDNVKELTVETGHGASTFSF